MPTRAVTVRIPDDQYPTLVAMAEHLGTTLPNALAMSATAALNRGKFDINLEPAYRFTPDQEERLEKALDRAHAHPEAMISLEDWAKEKGIL